MIRNVAAADQAALLALNNAHAIELSALSAVRLSALLEMAYAARVVGTAEAFLLAFDEAAAYDSPNYLWFRERYERFVYIDRIVVAPAARGHGLARSLYADLMAQVSGRSMLACEINVDLPNPASDALHASLGFSGAGHGAVGGKFVRYLTRTLA